MSLTFTNLSACIDCALYVANGEIADPAHGWTAEAVNARWLGSHLGYGWSEDATPEDPDLGFSALPCDCCGSRLGGDRVKLHASRQE